MLTPVIPIIEEESEPKNSSRDKIKGVVKRKHINRHIKRVYRVAKSKLTPKPKVKVKKVVLKEEVELEKKPKISLKMTSQNYMQIMKERFAKSKNPKVALSMLRLF